MKSELLEPPRFKGGPYMCKVTNCGAYPSENAIRRHFDDIPGASITHIWQCHHCEGFHYLGLTRGPAGASSGTDRRAMEQAERNNDKYVELTSL